MVLDPVPLQAHLDLIPCLAPLPQRVVVVVQEQMEYHKLADQGAVVPERALPAQFLVLLVTLQTFRHLKEILVETHLQVCQIMGQVEVAAHPELALMGQVRMAATAALAQHQVFRVLQSPTQVAAAVQIGAPLATLD